MFRFLLTNHCPLKHTTNTWIWATIISLTTVLIYYWAQISFRNIMIIFILFVWMTFNNYLCLEIVLFMSESLLKQCRFTLKHNYFFYWTCISISFIFYFLFAHSRMTADKDQEVLSKVSNAAKTSIGVHVFHNKFHISLYSSRCRP